MPLDKAAAALAIPAIPRGSLIRPLILAATVLALSAPRLSAQQPGPEPLLVREVNFTGNRSVPADSLLAAIATSSSSGNLLGIAGVDRRFFDETEFRRDVIRLTILYRQRGFPDARVDTLVRRGPRDVRVTFAITEGRPIRVVSLDVLGTERVMPGPRVARGLPLHVGEPFNRFRWAAAADSIRALLRDHGYPFAQVLRNYDVDRAQRTATVVFVADPGPLARVRRVDVQGTQAIDPDLVRRMLSLHPGEEFSQRGLYDSQRDLYALGLFNFASVSLADTTPQGAADSLVDLVVRVSEGPLQRVRFGAGWGNVDCFRGLSSWTDRNFLGGARALELGARVSKIGTGAPFAFGFEQSLCHDLSDEQDPDRLKLNYLLTATLRQPFVFGRRSTATLTLSSERHSEFQAFVREAVSAELALTQQTAWLIPITVSYQVSYGSTVASPAIFCSFLNQCGVNDTVFSQRRLQSTVGLGLVRDRSDSPLDPTSGSIITADVRYAGQITGSDSLSRFAKTVLEVAAYHELARRTVFAWRVRAGSIVSPELGSVGQFVPPQERFYGGGPSSVRGYAQNELGPVVRVIGDSIDSNHDGVKDTPADTITAPTGGNQLLFANVELRFPLPVAPDRLRAALFLDVGQVFQRTDELVSLRNIRATPGVGVRFATPLGPVRLDVAYNGYAPEVGPLYRQQGTTLVLVDPAFAPAAPTSFIHRLRVHLSVGQAF